MNFKVYHHNVTAETRFRAFSEEAATDFPTGYTLVATVSCPSGELGEAYAKTQHMEEPWTGRSDVSLPPADALKVLDNPGMNSSIVLQRRSTAVGDVLEDEHGDRYVVAGIGFTKLPKKEFVPVHCCLCDCRLPALPSDQVVNRRIYKNGELSFIELAHVACAPPSWLIEDAVHEAKTRAPKGTDRFQSYYTPEKVAALQDAFNRVVPAGNWKMALDTTVRFEKTDLNRSELADIVEACLFFGAGDPKLTLVGKGKVRVQAPGYYATVGA